MAGIVLITGGSRGIGAATARKAASAGYAVAVNYRQDDEAASALIRDLQSSGTVAIAVQGDVSSQDDIVRVFDSVSEQIGVPTALVNSAGISGGHSRVEDFDSAVLEQLMKVNVIGTMLCCREAAKRMSTANGGSGGAIVNVTSMAGTIGGRPGSSHYAASKAALDSFTMGFAKEVATEGIRVNAVRPGVTLTDMTAAVRDDPKLRRDVVATIAMNRAAEPEEMAAPIVWLLSDEASFISGCRLDASGGGFVIAASTKET
ncbi:MAG: SDR family oxidoreductase [Hyphomicrobiaceae bacterium]